MAFLDILGAIATPVTSLVGGVMNMIEGDNNRDYNASQSRAAMNFQREMFDKQNVEYRQRLQLEQNYNDPANIARRYAGIGINPGNVLAPSEGSATVFGSPSPSVSPAPSAPTPPYVSLSGSGDMATSLEKLGSFVGNLARARKDVAEGTSISKMMDGQVENLRLVNALKAQELIGVQIDNVIKRDTGLKKALMDIRLIQSQINLNTFLGYESEAKKDLIDWQSFTEQAKAKLSNAEYLKLLQLLPLEIKNQEEYNNVLLEEGRKFRAEGDQAFAAAGKYKAETKTEDVLREHRVNLTKNQVAEAAKRVQMSEVEIRKKLAELCQAEDKAKFLNENPKIKRVISFLESLGDAASLGVLKGIISVK